MNYNQFNNVRKKLLKISSNDTIRKKLDFSKYCSYLDQIEDIVNYLEEIQENDELGGRRNDTRY